MNSFFIFWILCFNALFAQSAEDLWSKLFVLEKDLNPSEWIALASASKAELALRLQGTLSHPEMAIRARSAWALGILGVSENSIRESLKKALNDPELLVQLEATEALRNLGAMEMISLQIPLQALNDKRYILRIRALEILSSLASEESLDAVCELLQDRNWTLRRLAVITLGKIKSPKSLSVLLPLIPKERSVPVLQEMIQTLGAISDPLSVPALLPFLKHPSLFIREQTATVLFQLTGQHYSYNLEQFKERQQHFSTLTLEEQSRFLDELQSALQDGNWEFRFSALDALMQLQQPTDLFLGTLLQGLNDPSRQVRYLSAGALGKLKFNAISAIPALIETSNDPDDYVRMWAVWALGQIDARQAVSVLEKALTDTHPQVRRVAEEALKRLR